MAAETTTEREAARSAAVRATGLLFTPAEEAFDRLTRLACRLAGAPMALLSLIDTDGHFVKSHRGLPEPWATSRLLPPPLSRALCRHVVAGNAPLVAGNAREHPLIGDNPVVAAFGIAAYLGFPLLGPGGHPLGALCVVDGVPRAWSDDERAALADLAAAAATELALRAELAERRRAEAALRESEARLHDFVDASSDWPWETDEEHRYLGVGERFREVIGRDPAWLVGRRRLDFRDGGDPADSDWDAHARLLEARLPFRDFVYGFADDQGRRRVVAVSGVPVFDPDGRFRGYRGTGRDVTRQIEAGERLSESEARFRSLVTNMRDIIFCRGVMGDAAHGYDAGGALLFGADAPRIAGTVDEAGRARIGTWYDAVHPDDRGRYLEAERRRKERHEAYALDYRITHPNTGEERWMREVAWTVRDEAAARTFFDSYIIDITEQKRVEAALRESEERATRRLAELDSLYATAPLGLASVDVEGRYLRVNEQLAMINGVPAAAHLGRTVREVVPELAGQVEPLMRRVLASGRPVVDAEIRGSTAAAPGVTRDWLASLYPVRAAAGGTVVALNAVVQEVTERKALEEQLRQTQKMEALGQLTGGVAHDFNNLLAVMVMDLDLIGASKAAADPEVAELVDEALGVARAGAELTGRLLAFARRQRLEPEVVDLARLVGGTVDMLRRALGGQVRVETALEPGLWPVRVDPAQLQNALLNLALNARDAMPGGGGFTIRAENGCAVEEARALETPGGGGPGGPDGFVTLAVVDTGGGMPPEVAARAFEPFFTTKDAGRGSGLGLSMVYGFAQQSGGRAALRSRVGGGTEIRLWLPRARGAVAAARAAGRKGASRGEAPRPTPPPGRGEAILLVEDHGQLRGRVARALAGLGYRVTAAASGGEALARAAGLGRLDLLFTDLVMPGALDGEALAAELRRLRPGLPVLFATGYARRAATPARPIAGPVLAKPYSIDRLALELRRLLDPVADPAIDPVDAGSGAARRDAASYPPPRSTATASR